MRARIVTCFLAGLAFAVGLALASAQPAPGAAFAQSPFAASGAKDTSPASAGLDATRGLLHAFLSWIVDTQQAMQRQLADAIKRFKTESPFAAALGLAGLSFLYGVVHAVGPGHGKTVISSYVVANGETVRRGVIISFLAAAVQATTAVALVGLFAVVLNASGLTVMAWSRQFEAASYALIMLVGLWLLGRQLNVLWRSWRPAPAITMAGPGNPSIHLHHDNGCDHGHGLAVGGHHHHAHGEACHHIVDAKAVAGPMSFGTTMATVLSVGIRPCSGAILVLIFALTQGIFWAGAAAAFAMAVGTAITVAALATLALGSRELALRLGGDSPRWAQGVWTACAIGGALIILTFGATLFAASLGPARPF